MSGNGTALLDPSPRPVVLAGCQFAIPPHPSLAPDGVQAMLIAVALELEQLRGAIGALTLAVDRLSLGATLTEQCAVTRQALEDIGRNAERIRQSQTPPPENKGPGS